MKAIIYQQADAYAKQPAVIMEFPDALPEDEVQNTECEKKHEEIHCILQHAAIEHIMSTSVLSENEPVERTVPEENI